MSFWMEEYMSSKYHLSIAKRLYDNYQQFSEKRFLTGMINEMAKATSRIIKAYLQYNKKRRFKDFVNILSKQYLKEKTRENIIKTLEIEKAQKRTPVQFAKGNKIIMLIEGKYRILTVERLGELLKSVEETILVFQKNFRQI